MTEPVNTIRDCREFIINELTGLYPSREIKSLSNIILIKLTGLPLSSLLSDPGKHVSEPVWIKINEICDHLKVFMPIQYILGETEFLGHTLRVSDSVLIPRPETEELADLVIRENQESHLRILDVGTGSGAIAISLALGMNSADIRAIDISSEIIGIAEVNSRINGAGVTFIQDNILEPTSNHLIYDIIVSNPPYVREMEKSRMSPNILNYEPHIALFVPDDDPLLFYRAIMEFSEQRLSPGGKLYFEINEELGSEVYDLA
ncbi:MAG: peptide chain release factor N(5)-glutamine methyltransferase, partial [Bacteroidia bacterium]